MKFVNSQVCNLDGAFRGMRNPLQSWHVSDSAVYLPNNLKLAAESYAKEDTSFEELLLIQEWLSNNANASDGMFLIGANDMKLATNLCKAGPEHRKFLRQIIVCVDVTAPLYIWKELDTYKVGTTANSTSTMHKLASTPITLDCFEIQDYNSELKVYNKEPYQEDSLVFDHVNDIIEFCETLRKRYVESKDVRYWKELVRWLPESWLQIRTITMNYENIRNICSQRKGHRLNEWKEFINWARSLPYADQLIFDEPVPKFDKK